MDEVVPFYREGFMYANLLCIVQTIVMKSNNWKKQWKKKTVEKMGVPLLWGTPFPVPLFPVPRSPALGCDVPLLWGVMFPEKGCPVPRKNCY